MPLPPATASITLSDGRALAYAEYGAPAGAPALYFHGTPGGRLEGRFLEDAARANGVRLIAVDRPGYGASTFHRGRRLSAWPGDVAQLADALGLDRFAVVGLSGGGPHAQACAAAMPRRVTAAAIVSGAGSPEAALDGRGRFGRLVARAVLALMPLIAWFVALWLAFWIPLARQWMLPRWIDRTVMKRRPVREAFLQELRAAVHGPGRAIAQDLALFSRPWGFSPRAVGAVPVHLWHGEADTLVPVSVGRYYARRIPGCRATFIPRAGHLMVVDHADGIMATIRAASASAYARPASSPGP